MGLGEEVKPGTLLLTEQPFVYVLTSKYRTEYCDFCFAKSELRKCASCHYVYYCGRSCQKDGWSIHKHECNNLKRISPRIIPDAARLLSRILKKLAKGGSEIKSYYTKTKYRKFKDLMSHYTNIKDDINRIEHFQSLCGVLNDFLGTDFIPNPIELMGMYGRMCVNSFNICDEELKSLGTGIYLAASIIDHSCQPTAVATFQGTRLNIRATETMPCLNWDKVFVSYIDTLYKPEARQKELMATYYFMCQCPKCLDPLEPIHMSAAACSNPHCDSLVEIRDYDQVSNCDQCDSPISPQFKQLYKDVTEFTDVHLQNMKLAYLDVCKVCLNRHKGVLHNLNIQHVRILDSAFESSIDFGQWDDAKIFGISLIAGYRKYLGDTHPLLGILYLKLAKILIYQENIQDGKQYLHNACKIIKITHGEDSNLYRSEIASLIQDCMY
ncbi:hypothetical protein PPYR_06028 [Photinus pyralis]|uniref:MYND-type domain-containing protein n=1 Tax=Photinus pyralis TaxID=7054 RepID=A0A5N4AST9_PHOPY|nr:histone-lysine N-methyltransferase SMYD3-like [Photinus pyralis]KAB0800288.1 hypothetical protein PPYR_06028 [Photinus pyralis]